MIVLIISLISNYISYSCHLGPTRHHFCPLCSTSGENNGALLLAACVASAGGSLGQQRDSTTCLSFPQATCHPLATKRILHSPFPGPAHDMLYLIPARQHLYLGWTARKGWIQRLHVFLCKDHKIIGHEHAACLTCRQIAPIRCNWNNCCWPSSLVSVRNGNQGKKGNFQLSIQA